MTTNEVLSGEIVQYRPADVEVFLSDRDLDMIRRQIQVPRGGRAPSDQEVEDFGRYCMAQRLNPFDRQIYLANIGGRWQPFTGVHGRLTIAFRTGAVAGMEGPFFCHKREGAERAHPPDWDELWDDDEPPHAAKFVVYRRGLDRAPAGIARWSYYAFNVDKEGRRSARTGLWINNPPLMLGYKAITRALNLSFPDVMPPSPDRADEEPEIDESAGYSRDTPHGEPGPGAGAMEGANPVTTPRPGPTAFVVPTREQVERVVALRGRALALADRRAWLEYVSRVVGWVVTDTRELDRDDTAELIWRMEAEFGQTEETQPDPDAMQSEEEGE